MTPHALLFGLSLVWCAAIASVMLFTLFAH
jgi:hypothetical protein